MRRPGRFGDQALDRVVADGMMGTPLVRDSHMRVFELNSRDSAFGRIGFSVVGDFARDRSEPLARGVAIGHGDTLGDVGLVMVRPVHGGAGQLSAITRER